MDTRPSTPKVASKVEAKRSQAVRTSSVVRTLTISFTLAPADASRLISARYLSEPLMAAEKILGLVVTPTTLELEISSASEPLSSRSRDKSSSQMDTPASDKSCSELILVCLSFGDGFLGGTCYILGGETKFFKKVSGTR